MLQLYKTGEVKIKVVILDTVLLCVLKWIIEVVLVNLYYCIIFLICTQTLD